MKSPIRTILVTGATGYLGARLVPRLLEEGYAVRALARSPRKLNDYPWVGHPRCTVVQGDVADFESTRAACEGIDAAYYLVHSMIAAGEDYAERDRRLADNFARAAKECGVQRIVYMGGLGELGDDLSEHLLSRREVETVLASHEVPVTVLRAAMIIGSGSASFEILRYLVDRLPVMVTPRWVRTETQPIAVRDVLRYLVQTLQVPGTVGQTYDIGGRDIVNYEAMMRLMAEKIGLPRRWIIPVPVLTPKLSSLWIGLVTPVTGKIARPLAEGLRNRTVCRDDRAQQDMPGPLFGVEEAVEAALGQARTGNVESRWSTAGEIPGDPEWSGGTVFRDRRELEVPASAATTFRTVSRIGGSHGYWGVGFLWFLRGAMDKLVGGPGLRRGRRHREKLSYGEAVDFWRVTGYQSDRLLQLRAEMKLPGEAELRFDVEPIDDGNCRLIQTALFRPRGLMGILYWYSVVPLHSFVFQTMLRGICREASDPDQARIVPTS